MYGLEPVHRPLRARIRLEQEALIRAMQYAQDSGRQHVVAETQQAPNAGLRLSDFGGVCAQVLQRDKFKRAYVCRR